jgi:hypothetical protein
VAEEENARLHRRAFLVLLQRFKLLADALPGCAVGPETEGGLVGRPCLFRVLAGGLQISNSF